MIGTPIPPIVDVTAADTLAALKAIRGRAGLKCVLAGYYAAGDGGGGLFWWDPTSTATPDDGLVVQATGVAVGRWRRIYSGRADVRWWGAVADGATARHARFQAALSAGVGHLYVPYVGADLMLAATLVIASNTWLECHPLAVIKLAASGGNRVMLRNTTYFGTDSDIILTGGQWDGSNLAGNCANPIGHSTATGTGLGALISFAGVARPKVLDAIFRGANCSATQFASCNDWQFSGHADALPQDFLHTNGPFQGGHVWWATGATVDDGIVLQGEDWLYGSTVHGEVTDVLVENVNMTRCGTTCVKISPSANAAVRRVTLRDIHCGSSDVATVKILADTDTPDPLHVIAPGVAEDITIDGLQVENCGNRMIWMDGQIKKMRLAGLKFDGVNNGGTGIYIAPTANVDSIKIRDLEMADTVNLGVGILVDGGVVGSLSVKGGRFVGRVVVDRGPLLMVTNGAAVDQATFGGMKIDAPLGYVFQVNAGASVEDLTVNDMTITTGANGDPPVVHSAGGLKRLRVGKVDARGCVAFLRTVAGASPLEVWFEACRFKSVIHPIWNQGSTIVLYQDRCTYEDMVANLARLDTSAAASLTIYSTHCRMIGTAQPVFTNASGGVCRYDGIDIPQDLTALNGAVKWDVARSSTLATGPAMHDGSVWQKWGHA